jgi:SH3 domain protein
MWLRTKNKTGAIMNWMTVKKIIPVILFMVSFIMTASTEAVFAETRYVSDQLIISIRDGQNPSDTVLGYIKTATPVDVIEDNGDYSRVKTEDGIEGWVQTKYIVSEKPKALIIQDLRNEIKKLDKDIASSKDMQGDYSNTLLETKKMYERKIRELKEEININQKFAAKAKRDLIQLNNKYKKLLSHSESTDELITEAEKLKKLNTQLNTEIKSLKKQYKSPLKSTGIQSFFAGAGVLLLGYLLGGSAKKRKRSRFV